MRKKRGGTGPKPNKEKEGKSEDTKKKRISINAPSKDTGGGCFKGNRKKKGRNKRRKVRRGKTSERKPRFMLSQKKRGKGNTQKTDVS